jgi:hypothetical protein
MLNNYIKLDSIENALWSKHKLLDLANYITINSSHNKEIFERLIHNNVLTKHIRSYLENVLKISNDMIIKVYWEEFKTIRNEYKIVFLAALNEKNNKKKNLELSIFQIFGKLDIHLDKEIDLIDSLETFVIETKTKVNMECKICYDKITAHVLIHDDHCCNICNTCIAHFRVNSPCPFCQTNINGKLRLNIL